MVQHLRVLLIIHRSIVNQIIFTIFNTVAKRPGTGMMQMLLGETHIM